jgi:hypothetical protein
MFEFAALVMADFTAPEEIGTNPQSLLLLLPLVAAIAVIYKATKLPHISAGNFLKESVALFCSIVVFMVITAIVLSGVAWLVTE